MVVTTKDLMRELRNLIYNKKIVEEIVFLEQHKEQLQNAMENDITILYLNATKRWKRYEQALSSRCEIESDAKRDNQVQWLPFTPLSDTIELSSIHRLFKLLLEYGAEVNGQDHIRRTPLHLAAEQGDESMVRLLL